jgi:hypothetical protein
MLNPETIDFKKLGFYAGIAVHQYWRKTPGAWTTVSIGTFVLS